MRFIIEVWLFLWLLILGPNSSSSQSKSASVAQYSTGTEYTSKYNEVQISNEWIAKNSGYVSVKGTSSDGSDLFFKRGSYGGISGGSSSAETSGTTCKFSASSSTRDWAGCYTGESYNSNDICIWAYVYVYNLKTSSSVTCYHAKNGSTLSVYRFLPNELLRGSLLWLESQWLFVQLL